MNMKWWTCHWCGGQITQTHFHGLFGGGAERYHPNCFETVFLLLGTPWRDYARWHVRKAVPYPEGE